MEALLHKPKIHNITIVQTTGRPIFSGKSPDVVLSKLEYAFSIGCTVKEACCLAMINTSAYYRFLERRPEFRERFEGLQQIPAINAKKAIADELYRGNHKLAMWYLERKRPDEFSTNWVLRDMIDRLREENRTLREEVEYLLQK